MKCSPNKLSFRFIYIRILFARPVRRPGPPCNESGAAGNRGRWVCFPKIYIALPVYNLEANIVFYPLMARRSELRIQIGASPSFFSGRTSTIYCSRILPCLPYVTGWLRYLLYGLHLAIPNPCRDTFLPKSLIRTVFVEFCKSVAFLRKTRVKPFGET